MNSIKRLLIILVLGNLHHVEGFAQDNSLRKVPLKDLSTFKPQAGNWQVVGKVVMDPSVDIHLKEEAAPKKKKKRKNQEIPQAVRFEEGSGILLNMNDDTRKDHLITNFEHGDIELEMEVMLPKGSNSGLYLQGRYEIQLFDSWGVNVPKYSDMGGIYRNWESEPGKIYMGKAPLTNAAKAPGLWQHIKLLFKAPRFDENGKKIANAKFVYVDLNGVRIHDNVEVPLPTGGPLENNETARGAIMIQGDHGPVAIRNFRYKLLHELSVGLSDLSYKAYHGEFQSFDDLSGATPQLSGKTAELTYAVAGKDNGFGLVYEGKIHIAEDGKYEFYPECPGGFRLKVNGEILFDIDGGDAMVRNQHKTINLQKGEYPIELAMLKTVNWRAPRLGLFVKKEDTYKVPLHAFSSNPPDEDNVSPVLVSPGSQTKLLRAFLDYQGSSRNRLTHTIGVGDPDGIHYVYDLNNGNLSCVWRGDFVDATPMWHDRGDGSFRPRGAVEYLMNNQQLAALNNDAAPFPAKSEKEDFRSLGYEVEPSSGRPVFKYRYRDVTVKDRIYPDENGGGFVREISFENGGENSGMKYKLAEGESIEEISGSTYAVDHRYYIKLASGQQATVREVKGTKELVLAIDGSPVNYSIIW